MNQIKISMRIIFEKPILLFLISAFIIALPLCLFPINLFPGAIVYQEGLSELTVDAPLSLSYFLGFGYEKGDLEYVKTFYLHKQGILLAVLFIVGFPALLAYRVYLKKTEKK